MRDDPQMMVRGLENILQIVVGSAHHLLTEILGLSHMSACWILRLLMVEHRVDTAFREGWDLVRQYYNLRQDVALSV